MAGWTPCEGTGESAVDLDHYPARKSIGVLDPGSPASTYGKCPRCGFLIRASGIVHIIKVKRHKEKSNGS